jgi:hypothetical protein
MRRRLHMVLQVACALLLAAAWLLALRTGSLLQGFQTLPVIALGAAASVAALAAGAIALLQRAPQGDAPAGD